MKRLLALTLGIALGAFLIYSTLPKEPIEEPTPEKEERLELLFVGDIMPSRYVAKAMREHGYDFPFQHIATTTRSAGIAFGNLESPVLPGAIVRAGEMRFRTDPEFLPYLRDAGFDIVSLANNHAYDHGLNGITKTIEALRKNDITFAGVGIGDEAYRPTYITRGSTTVAFIAQNDPAPVRPHSCATNNSLGTACFNTAKLQSALEEASRNADFTVFTMHAGKEYTSEPEQKQIDIARFAVDHGADLVVGHHPHVIQSRENYNGKWIYYSLGNFIFDQSWSRNTTLGLMLRIEISAQSHEVLALHHNIIKIEEFARPRFADEEDIAERFSLLDLP